MAKATNKETKPVEEIVETEQEKAEVMAETGTEIAATAAAAPPMETSSPFAGLDLSMYGFSDDDLKGLTGLDKINSSEVSIPYAALISKKSRDHNIGDIVFADGKVIKGGDGEVMNGVSILAVQPVRVMFPTPFNPNNSYECRSIDGIKGHVDGKYAGTLCAECEFSKYPEGGGASPCRDQRLLLCTTEEGSLFHLQIGGVGMKVWKAFLSAQAFHLLPKVKQIFGALKVSMGVKMVDTPAYGEFPTIDFNIDPKDPFVDQHRLLANLNSLKAYKDFEQEHLESAADASRVQMAVSPEEEGPKQNSALF